MLISFAKEILVGAAALISQQEHWTRGTYSRDEQGREVRYDSEEACQWCASGAIMRSSRRLRIDWAERPDSGRWPEVLLETGLPEEAYNVAMFNDESTHEEVLELFRVAIDRCQTLLSAHGDVHLTKEMLAAA